METRHQSSAVCFPTTIRYSENIFIIIIIVFFCKNAAVLISRIGPSGQTNISGITLYPNKITTLDDY